MAEERVLQAWTELLGRTLGVHDNFFAGGGNSILAIRLVAEIRSAFDIALSVRDVFERPTVAGLAERVIELVLAEAGPTHAQ